MGEGIEYYISDDGVGWEWEIQIRGRGDVYVKTTYQSVLYNDYDVAWKHFVDEVYRLKGGAHVISAEFRYVSDAVKE